MKAGRGSLAEFGSDVVADALRDLGHLDRTCSPGLLPLDRRWSTSGRCRTALWAHHTKPDPDNYLELAAFIDSCMPGECIVMGFEGGAVAGSVWGELCATAAAGRGCTGVIIDGLLRDTLRLLQVGVPTFARGALAQDYQGRARFSARDIEIDCGGVTVRPGDMVVADIDGVVFVPSDLEESVFRESARKVEQETEIARALAGGRSLTEAVRATGTL